LNLVPTVRPYHWVYACIHAQPSRLIKTSDPEYTSTPRLVQFEDYVNFNGLQREITRPLKIYCTVNMPTLLPGEESFAQAAENVIARLEANGAYRSIKRATADVLILNKDTASGKKFAQEAKPAQTVNPRFWLEDLLDKKVRYVRGKPGSGVSRGTRKPKTEVVVEQPKASGSKSRVAVPAEEDEGWLKKPSIPFKG
jgi:hypothetical protein